MAKQTSITPVQNTQNTENNLRRIVINALAEQIKSDPTLLTEKTLREYPELLDIARTMTQAPVAQVSTPVVPAVAPAVVPSVLKQPATAPVVMQNSLSARIAAAKSKVSGNGSTVANKAVSERTGSGPVAYYGMNDSHVILGTREKRRRDQTTETVPQVIGYSNHPAGSDKAKYNGNINVCNIFGQDLNCTPETFADFLDKVEPMRVWFEENLAAIMAASKK